MGPEERIITVLGSTGSIGVQALDVMKSANGKFRPGFLTVNNNIDLLFEQVQKFKPYGIAIKNEDSYKEFKRKFSFGGKILCGDEGVLEAASFEKNDLVLSALVGFAGVLPTLKAIESGKTIALANKETLVSAGDLITKKAKENSVKIIAVDSEHSAVLQCIIGEHKDEIEKIILTASGGPFLDTPFEKFEDLTAVEALAHPNWSMGNKITIDSATMMNKGFEVIEAFWLFDLPPEKIDVLIHPQSIVHSMVQFVDGSIKAQLGLPDMRLPISYAFGYPRRLNYKFPRLNLSEISSLTFRQPDYQRFPCLSIAFDALNEGGTATTILNAANEISVNAFLEGKIIFTDIPAVISEAMNGINVIHKPNLDDIISADKETREFTELVISKRIRNL